MRRYPRALAAAVAVGSLAACGIFKANVAKDTTAPFVKAMAPAHAKLICDNGDSGYGLDNTVPWYTAYLTVDSHADVDGIVRNAASKAGYPLELDQPALDAYPYQTNAIGGFGFSGDVGPGEADIVAGVPFDPASTYLIARHNGVQFNVDIVPTSPVELLCVKDGDVKTYGRTQPPVPGRTIIVVSVVFPSTTASVATKATEAFIGGLIPARWQRICDNGDGGSGNTFRWSIAYLTVDPHTDVDGIVRDAASKAGYPLEFDQPALGAYPYQLPDGGFGSNAGTGQADIIPGVPFDPASTYLIAHRNGVQFNVDIVPTGSVKLLCPIGAVDAYGQVQPHVPGRTIIVVSASYPPTTPRPMPTLPSIPPGSVPPTAAASPS